MGLMGAYGGLWGLLALFALFALFSPSKNFQLSTFNFNKVLLFLSKELNTFKL